jgi:glycosyltransferase involved in cell wall biosynthesis
VTFVDSSVCDPIAPNEYLILRAHTLSLIKKFLRKAVSGGLISAIRLSLSYIWVRISFRLRTAIYRFKAGSNITAVVKAGFPIVSPPMITFVIPVYDREQMLIECVNSIWAQGYLNTEVLLVLDGSPQGTVRVARDLAKQDSRLRVIEMPTQSGNAIKGRNTGIAQARGEFIFFLDSDDICLPGRILTSLHAFSKPHVDVVYGGYYLRYLNIPSKSHAVVCSHVTFDLVRSINPLANSTVAVRKSAFLRCGMLKPTMAYREDHELWLRLCYMGCVFEAINAAVSEIRIHDGNNEANFRHQDADYFAKMGRVYFKQGPRPIRLVFVLPGLGLSGGIYVILRHANALAAEGMDVCIMSPPGENTFDWYPHTNTVRIVEYDKSLLDRADVAFATGWQTALNVINSSARHKSYFVQSDETRFVDDIAMKKVVAETYRMPFRYLTEARWIISWLRANFGHQSWYVPNGVDLALFGRSGRVLKQRGPRARVLIEGPIAIPWKGVEDAYRAVEGLDCDIWLVSSAGRPPSDWKIDRFFERVPMNEMGAIYRSCDIFVKMSRVEGFFGPPLEAMACGCAVAVAEVSGYDEFIVHDNNALVSPTGDIASMRDNVRRLISDMPLRRRLADCGRETSSHWAWDASFEAMEKFIESLP